MKVTGWRIQRNLVHSNDPVRKLSGAVVICILIIVEIYVVDIINQETSSYHQIICPLDYFFRKAFLFVGVIIPALH